MMSHLFLTVNSAVRLFIGITLLFTATFSFANDYESGHQALQVWDQAGQSNAPAWVQLWLKIMMLSFLAGLLFVWNHVEARWVVGGIIVGLLVSKFGIGATSIPMLSGLVALIHLIFWSPGLYFLLKNRPFIKGWSFYAVWSALITGVILFSFVFDIRDAAIYLNHIAGL
jgi:hypothetical protein